MGIVWRRSWPLVSRGRNCFPIPVAVASHTAAGVMLALHRRPPHGVRCGMLALIGAGLMCNNRTNQFKTDTVDAKTVDTRLMVWTIRVEIHPIPGIGFGNNSFVKKFPSIRSKSRSASGAGTHYSVDAQYLLDGHARQRHSGLAQYYLDLCCAVAPADSDSTTVARDRAGLMAAGIGLIGFCHSQSSTICSWVASRTYSGYWRRLELRSGPIGSDGTCGEMDEPASVGSRASA